VSSRLHVEPTTAPTQRNGTMSLALSKVVHPPSRFVSGERDASAARNLQRLRLSFCAATSQVTIGACARRQSTQTRRRQHARSRATTADRVASSCQRKRIQDASGMPGVACRRCGALSRQRTCTCRYVYVYAPNERIRRERKRRRARYRSPPSIAARRPAGCVLARWV